MSAVEAPTLRAPANKPATVLFASLIGTTIEFFDFYIYATAAVLVFPTLFFPGEDPGTALLSSFATFSIAFFARPIGALAFGHFGDRVGRKATLVAALMTMGLSTVAIGLLPTHQQVGLLAPLLLLPVRLKRAGLDPKDETTRFTLVGTGEDCEVNISLQEYLSRNFGLKLPELDEEMTPESYFEAVKKAIPSAETHVYQAGHAFANDARTTYVKVAAESAHARTLDFLRKVHAR